MNIPDIIKQEVGQRLKPSRFLIAAPLASLLLANMSPLAPEPVDEDLTSVSTVEWKLDWASDFNSATLPKPWSVRVMQPYGDSKEYTTEDNVWTYNGSAIESVDRHCLDDSKDIVTTENQTTGVCPLDKKTAYASGRIETPFIFSGDYKIDVGMNLADMAVAGTRIAVWMKNINPYCEGPGEPNRENDLELYSAKPNFVTATNYVYCDHGNLNASHHSIQLKKDWLQGDHTLSIEVVDEQVISYIDGEAVPINGSEEVTDSEATFPEVTSEHYAASMIDPTQLIVQLEAMSGDKDNALQAPNPNKPFPVQKAVIRYVRAYVPSN